ncbi:hypothetical protein L227DRAFT_111737 [Lentinus tigrinus ALCF2SS1-6]|uniref:Uncharacterized protein n=1 Tax=Lentinus tigrinus ALCF2SS1-6 TaxID=1328759 RepID=A0A5C2S7C2_9APHY|nr:hypothetical protein L227DRAFT_111737 [Lentinus tigrinus ALCF2SS1-6]
MRNPDGGYLAFVHPSSLCEELNFVLARDSQSPCTICSPDLDNARSSETYENIQYSSNAHVAAVDPHNNPQASGTEPLTNPSDFQLLQPQTSPTTSSHNITISPTRRSLRAAAPRQKPPRLVLPERANPSALSGTAPSNPNPMATLGEPAMRLLISVLHPQATAAATGGQPKGSPRASDDTQPRLTNFFALRRNAHPSPSSVLHREARV